MKDWRVNRLAEYNREVEHGVVHTPEYDAEMAVEQMLFHEMIQREHDAYNAAIAARNARRRASFWYDLAWAVRIFVEQRHWWRAR